MIVATAVKDGNGRSASLDVDCTVRSWISSETEQGHCACFLGYDLGASVGEPFEENLSRKDGFCGLDLLLESLPDGVEVRLIESDRGEQGVFDRLSLGG